MRTFAQVIGPPSVEAPSYRWTPSAVRGLLCSCFRGAIPFRRRVSSPATGLPSWRPSCPRHGPEASVAFTHVQVNATTAPVCRPCVWRGTMTTGPLVWRAMTAAAPPAPLDIGSVWVGMCQARGSRRRSRDDSYRHGAVSSLRSLPSLRLPLWGAPHVSVYDTPTACAESPGGERSEETSCVGSLNAIHKFEARRSAPGYPVRLPAHRQTSWIYMCLL
jgi:hypothetical protein